MKPAPGLFTHKTSDRNDLQHPQLSTCLHSISTYFLLLLFFFIYLNSLLIHSCQSLTFFTFISILFPAPRVLPLVHDDLIAFRTFSRDFVLCSSCRHHLVSLSLSLSFSLSFLSFLSSGERDSDRASSPRILTPMYRSILLCVSLSFSHSFSL